VNAASFVRMEDCPVGGDGCPPSPPWYGCMGDCTVERPYVASLRFCYCYGSAFVTDFRIAF
jgi:hypothetical protein